MFMCMPVHRVFLPLLHLLLGLVNDLCSKFKDQAYSRIERQSQEEIEAQNMPFVVELMFDEVLIKLDYLKNEA